MYFVAIIMGAIVVGAILYFIIKVPRRIEIHGSSFIQSAFEFEASSSERSSKSSWRTHQPNEQYRSYTEDAGDLVLDEVGDVEIQN